MPEVNGVNKVLVVSDDPRIRHEARYGFPDGVEVDLATDAREAWESLQTKELPTVLVVDIQTGSAGGFGLCKDIASDEYLKDLPVLMLLERDQDRWLAQQAGARLIRTKPIDTMDLVSDALSLTD